MNPGLVAHTVKLILGIYTATKSVFAGSPKKFFFFANSAPYISATTI
jgi:hypothetical protein